MIQPSWQLRFNRWEEYFFYGILLLNLWPLFNVSYFPTLDGPAHLYNAHLIKDILFSKDAFAADFFSLQTEPVPNWTGHVLLLILSFFFSTALTQKIFLILLLSSLPIAFRALVKTSGAKHYLFSYLIFPFSYSFVFYLGFYNFLLGVLFLLLTLIYHIRQINSAINYRRALTYFGLFALCYFSHVFVFAMLLCCIALQEISLVFLSKDSGGDFGFRIKKSLVNGLKLMLIALPFLVLLLAYFWKRPTIGEAFYKDKTELVDWIQNIRPIIALHFQIEEVYTKKLFYLIASLSIIAMYEFLSTKQPSKASFFLQIQSKLKRSDAWLLMSTLFLFLYFYLPDSDGNAGFVSVRLGLLFFIFLILWIAAQPLPLLLGGFAAMITLFCNFSLNKYYMSENKIKSAKIEDLMAVKDLIQPNTVLLPLNFEEDWLLGHSPNLLGADKSIVVLENYEAGTNYFPLQWKIETLPNFTVAGTSISNFACVACKYNATGKQMPLDYIYQMGTRRDTSNTCENDFFNKVQEGYKIIYTGFNGVLWQRNDLN